MVVDSEQTIMVGVGFAECAARSVAASLTGPDACSVWRTTFLTPIRLEVPSIWFALLNNWTRGSFHARWESVTGTPLELNVSWVDDDAASSREKIVRRIGKAWERQQQNAEKQAKTTRRSFVWEGEAFNVEKLNGDAQIGHLREYRWQGFLGCLGIFCLSADTRRVFVSLTCCPQETDEAARKTFVRILKSMRLTLESERFSLQYQGLALDLPAGFRLDVLNGREGHLYATVFGADERLTFLRLGCAEWHLGNSDREIVFRNMAKKLFDRSDGAELIKGMGQGVVNSSLPAWVDEHVAGHNAFFFREKRPFYMRAGDWVLRKLGRKWYGAAVALLWYCPESHTIQGIAVRSGTPEFEIEQLLRQRLEGFACHGHSLHDPLDWRNFLQSEAKLPAEISGDTVTADGAPLDPGLQRKLQLSFRVRRRPEVRLEPYSDGRGALIYHGAPATGTLAKLLRGAAESEGQVRRLELDAMGRRLWECMDQPKAVYELLSDIAPAWGMHPVEMFPKLLSFLKMLGDRRLVEQDRVEALERTEPVEEESRSRPAKKRKK